MKISRKTTFGALGLAALLLVAGIALAHGGPRGERPANAPALAFERDGDTLRDVTLARGNESILLLESVRLVGATDATDESKRGHVLRDDAGTVLHARPGRGAHLRAFSPEGATLVLVLPEGASLVQHAAVDAWSPAGATITYADGTQANLALRNATLAVDGPSLTVTLGPDGSAHFGLAGEHGFAKPHGKAMHAMRGGHGMRHR